MNVEIIAAFSSARVCHWIFFHCPLSRMINAPISPKDSTSQLFISSKLFRYFKLKFDALKAFCARKAGSQFMYLLGSRLNCSAAKNAVITSPSGDTEHIS